MSEVSGASTPDAAGGAGGLEQEPVLEPALEIVDPHHHLWDRDDSTYLVDQLREDTGSGHNVRQTVFIECMAEYRTTGPEAMRPVGETEFVAAQATKSRDGAGAEIAAIVGYADLTLGEDVREVLEAHLEAGQGLFRGIRHAGGWHASDSIRNSHTQPFEHLYLDEAFRRGFAQLERYELSFEAWQYHTQLDEVADLARAFPGARIILNHCGGPLGIGPYEGKRDEVLAEWRPRIEGLAGCENVVVKLGGAQMPINGFGWHKREELPGSRELQSVMAPYYEHCLECFGPERSMFESNFPVDRVSCSYRVLWNLFKRLAEGLSEGEKADAFAETARRVYRLTAS